MPNTIIELGQKLKAKHPGAYDSMDDAEVGRRLKVRYPGAYDQFMDVPGVPIPSGLPPDLQGNGEGNSISGGGNEPGIPKIVADGMRQLYHAAPAFSNSVKRGASDVMEGVGRVMSPLLIPAAIAAPLATAGTVIGSAAGGAAGSGMSALAGGDPETQRLVGNLASLPAAVLGGGTAESPRLAGYAKGVIKAIPSATKAGLSHHLIPDPFAAAGKISAGATEGAKGKLWMGDGMRAIRDFFSPQTEAHPTPSGTLGTGPQSGFGPSPKATPPPVEVGGTSITGIPDFTGISPEEMAARIHQEKYPTLHLASPKTGNIPSGTMGSGPQSGFGPSPKLTLPPIETGGAHITDLPPRAIWDRMSGHGATPEEMAQKLSAIPETSGPTASSKTGNARFVPGQYDAPRSRINPIEVGGSHVPDYQPPSVLTPEQINAVQLPDWMQKALPEKASTPAAASEMSLLDDIARGQAGKQFSKLTPEQQATVRGIAARMGGGTVTPKPSFISPVEASLPGGKAVIAPVAAQPSTSPVTSPVSSAAPSQTVTPVAPTPTPGGTAMPHIETPAGLQDHYVSELKRINPIQSGNAVNKDLAIAQRLKGMGVTPESLDKMTDADLNPHYTSLGYKKLGSDNGGRQYGRTAEVGRQHLRMALENLWKP